MSYSLMQFTLASTIYYVCSTLFPAKETYMDAAILPDDAATQPDERDSDDLEKSSFEKGDVQADIHTNSIISAHDV